MYSLIDVAQKKDVNVILFDRNKPLALTEDLRLSLTSPVYLKRSTHPTFALSVSAFGETITYLAESAPEADLVANITPALSASDHIILGTHGPKTKESLSDNRLFDAEYVFVYDDHLLSFIDPDRLADTHLIYGSDHITIRLQNKKQ